MSMTPLGPCELHEVSNCTYCSGRDKAFEASVLQPAPDPNSPLPVIAGGPTIHAKFDGNCASCGRRYQAGEGIHHDRAGANGWVGVECCA